MIKLNLLTTMLYTIGALIVSPAMSMEGNTPQPTTIGLATAPIQVQMIRIIQPTSGASSSSQAPLQLNGLQPTIIGLPNAPVPQVMEELARQAMNHPIQIQSDHAVDLWRVIKGILASKEEGPKDSMTLFCDDQNQIVAIAFNEATLPPGVMQKIQEFVGEPEAIRQAIQGSGGEPRQIYFTRNCLSSCFYKTVVLSSMTLVPAAGVAGSVSVAHVVYHVSGEMLCCTGVLSCYGSTGIGIMCSFCARHSDTIRTQGCTAAMRSERLMLRTMAHRLNHPGQQVMRGAR